MIHNPTILDIAKALGISKSTVSRALAGAENVKPQTRKAILDMAEKMRYKPNYMARNLTKSRTRIVGVVVPEFINSFFSRVIIRIQNVFEQEGYRVLITQCNESWEVERKNLRLLEEAMVEGILISVTEKGRNSDYYRELAAKGIPIVFFNRAEKGIEASQVLIDDYKWAFFATEHLIGVRRRLGQEKPRIMHFRGPDNIDLSGRRYWGYADALMKHHLSLEDDLTVRVKGTSREDGFLLMKGCIEKGNVPDALFCFSDHLAIGAMLALRQNGIEVPHQVSVMGFSESQSALVTMPALSSVAQPLEEMGETAARLLLERIENPDAGIRRVILDASLNIRGSSDPEFL